VGLSGKTLTPINQWTPDRDMPTSWHLVHMDCNTEKFSACLSLLISAYYQQHIMDQILLGGDAKENLH